MEPWELRNGSLTGRALHAGGEEEKAIQASPSPSRRRQAWIGEETVVWFQSTPPHGGRPLLAGVNTQPNAPRAGVGTWERPAPLSATHQEALP